MLPYCFLGNTRKGLETDLLPSIALCLRGPPKHLQHTFKCTKNWYKFYNNYGALSECNTSLKPTKMAKIIFLSFTSVPRSWWRLAHFCVALYFKVLSIHQRVQQKSTPTPFPKSWNLDNQQHSLISLNYQKKGKKRSALWGLL